MDPLGASSTSAITIRQARPEDAAECGRICFEAFYKINTDQNFPPEIPTLEIANSIISMMFAHPGVFSVVAELNGRIVGSNCMDERGMVGGVGPITVDPTAQNRGIGRMLMQAVLDRARERRLAGVRLVQAAFHNRSLALYASLGFEIREPLSLMHGAPMGQTIAGYSVRPATMADLDECNRVCRQVHGHDRGGELSDAIGQGSAVVVERGGRVTAYATAVAFFGHAVAETNTGLQAIIAAAPAFGGPGILVPSRNTALFHWCLKQGLRVVEPLTLMTTGLYNEPSGAFIPSIAY
jgi:predicted N-acetyltransferase YhbS